MSKPASYVIVTGHSDGSLRIKDTGGETNLSVTNDVENVVQDLVSCGLLPKGRRLFYFDTNGDLDEILIRDGRFAGFAPGPNRRGMGEYLPRRG